MVKINVEEKNDELIERLYNRTYGDLILKQYENQYTKLCRKYGKNKARVEMGNYLGKVMNDCGPSVGRRLSKRKKEGYISDKGQAVMSLVGNGFQGIVAYYFIKNLDRKGIMVLLNANNNPILKNRLKLKVGDNVVKPDADIVLLNPNKKNSPIIIFSCKTSIRERIGQSLKWKLMLDIARLKCNCRKKNNKCLKCKYGMSIDFKNKIYYGFITADFYDELHSSHNLGTLNFFDSVYLANKMKSSNNKIKKLPKSIKEIKSILSQ